MVKKDLTVFQNENILSIIEQNIKYYFNQYKWN